MCLPLAKLKLFKSESLTMEDLKRSSSCHNFSSEKAKRRQELNSSPLIKHAVRSTLSASSSPQTSHRKSKVATALSLPLTTAFKDDKEERYNHVFDNSKANERKKPISSSNSFQNTYARPQLKQTPSIVINSPPISDRGAVDITDITLTEPTTRGESFERSRPGKDGQMPHFNKEQVRGTDRGDNKYLSRDKPLQQQGKGPSLQFQASKDREPYSKFPYEKQRGNTYEYEIFTDREDNVHRKSPNQINLTDNYRDLQTRETYSPGPRNVTSGERNAEPKARNVDIRTRITSPGARSVEPRTRKVSREARSPGARNLDQSSSDEERMVQQIRTPPTIFSVRIDNPEGFKKPTPKYLSGDATDGSSLPRAHYVGNHVSVPGQTNTNKQIPRHSQSEINLKSKSTPERTIYPAVKTLSAPVGTRADPRTKPRNETFSSEISLPTNALERQLKSPENRSTLGNDKSEKCSRNKGNSPLLRRLGHNEVGSEPQQGKHIFPPVSNELDKHSHQERHNKDNFQAAKSKGHSKTGFDKAGPSPENSSYEPKHTTRPLDTTLSRGLTNDSFQAEKETNKEANSQNSEAMVNERSKSEVFGGLLGETDANHSAEYYDQMISKINEQINLAVSRNKSPYALYGLGSDDDDDWC